MSKVAAFVVWGIALFSSIKILSQYPPKQHIYTQEEINASIAFNKIWQKAEEEAISEFG
jgi:hypothetical protein